MILKCFLTPDSTVCRRESPLSSDNREDNGAFRILGCVL
jgi:hypothetical protein